MSGRSPRILIVRLSAFGDCLHTVPALVALRRKFPEAHIGWAIEKLPYSVLHGHPMVDSWHIFPRQALKLGNSKIFDGMRDMSSFRKDLIGQHYDAAIDFQGLTKSGLVTWWSRAKQRIGFKGEDSREFNLVFANKRVKPPEEAVHVVEKNLSLLKPLGVELPEKPEWVMPSYAPEIESTRPFLNECGLIGGDGQPVKYVIINPGATWFTKRYPPELFGEVAKGLVAQRKMPVVVTWAGDDEHKAAQTISTIAGGKESGVFVAPKTNLRELAALTSQAVLFVSNDTGPLHLAVALKVRTVAIFGATDPLRNGAYGSGHRVQTGGIDCHPCWKTTCERVDRACLTQVKPGDVVSSCNHILDRMQ
ncbi:MAG: glycosyltransferase family 9 protein [Planctomycetota bacterium]